MIVDAEEQVLEYQELLGEGAYGKVYRAVNIKTGVHYAVKFTDYDPSSEGVAQSVLREISILKTLKHPNLIPLQGVQFIPSGVQPRIQLIFEYMDQDLNKFLKKNKTLDPSKAKIIMRQIIEGLKYMHKEKVIHRDLKPHNVLINQMLEVKIADFGLARIVTHRLVTMSKEIETLWYRAPQLLLGAHKYDYGVDIWSLGCIFYQLTQGKIMFPEDCQLGQLSAIFSYFGTPRLYQWPEIKDLEDFRPTFPKFHPKIHIYKNLSENGVDLLEKMMQVNPRKRISVEQASKHPYFFENDE